MLEGILLHMGTPSIVLTAVGAAEREALENDAKLLGRWIRDDEPFEPSSPHRGRDSQGRRHHLSRGGRRQGLTEKQIAAGARQILALLKGPPSPAGALGNVRRAQSEANGRGTRGGVRERDSPAPVVEPRAQR